MADEPSTAIGRLAAASNSAARRSEASDAAGRDLLGGEGERDVLRQVEVHGALRLAQGGLDRVGHDGGHASLAQRQARLGDRLEQRVVVDGHLDAPAELRGGQVAGERQQGRAARWAGCR
jgi:hypothetical protein